MNFPRPSVQTTVYLCATSLCLNVALSYNDVQHCTLMCFWGHDRCKIVVMATARKRAAVKRAGVDPYVATLLGRITIGKQELTFRKNEKIFRQGEPADSIYFIQTGRIKVTVVSATGKEAVLAMPGPHEFFGEGSLVMQSLRVSSAETLEPSTVFRVEKRDEPFTTSPSFPKNLWPHC